MCDLLHRPLSDTATFSFLSGIHLFVVCVFRKSTTSCEILPPNEKQNNGFLSTRKETLFRRHDKKNFPPVISCFGWKVLAIHFRDQWNFLRSHWSVSERWRGGRANERKPGRGKSRIETWSVAPEGSETRRGEEVKLRLEARRWSDAGN